MLTPAQLIQKTKIIVKGLFAPKGVVGPHASKQQWDNQFADGSWKYLGDEDQREHYDQIIELYLKYCQGGTILDIGCGQGLLFKYLKEREAFRAEFYTGIDISEVAIQEAKETYPDGDFKVHNYQDEIINEKYDAVIFNETLYYFNHAGKTFDHALNTNLNEAGKIIVSMCDYSRHDQIWKAIDKAHTTHDLRRSANAEGISWTVKIMS